MTTADEHSAASEQTVPATVQGGVHDTITPRLRVIEGLALAQRADAYVQLHDEMRDRLEGGDAPQTQG